MKKTPELLNVLQLDNTISFTPDANYEPATKKYVDGLVGITTFIELTDCPNTYAGMGGKYVAVKADVSGLEFVTLAGGGDMLKSTYDPNDDGVIAIAQLDTDVAQVSEIDDVPVDGEVAAPISSNWAFDHAALSTGVHGVGANYLAYTKDSQKEALFHNNYMARAYQTAAQSIAHNTNTIIILDAESYDPGGNFDTTNYRYTAPVAGYYLICGQIGWQSNTTGYRRQFIHKNGNGLVVAIAHVVTADWISPGPIVTIQHLDVADYIDIRGLQTSGGALSTAPSSVWTYLEVCLLQKD